MNAAVARAIKRVVEEASALNIEVVLVGGLVNEILQARDPRFPAVRLTDDADFAVHAPTWKSFDQLRNALIAKGATLDPLREHRLSVEGALIDLVPYGKGVTNEQGAITWPKTEFSMQVVGFEEACAAAVTRTIEGAGSVRVITAAGLALLKVISFLDRLQDPKHQSDAEDLDYWMRYYASDSEDRRFELPTMGLGDVDYGEADAALLGHDVGRLASDAAAVTVSRFLDAHADPYSPFVNALVSAIAEESERDRVVSRLNAFKAGFLAGRAAR